jgi:hypothetical protein
MKHSRIEMAGRRFSKLVVQSYAGMRNKEAAWNCTCECGKTIVVRGGALRRANNKSCGCLRGTQKGQQWGPGTSFYYAYQNAKSRCTNPNSPDWQRYGKRGIKFSFTSSRQLFDEIGSRPSTKHTLDRINNAKGYEPGNICWSTRTEQAQNRRKAVTAPGMYKGISRQKDGTFLATITVNGERLNLGTYSTEFAGALAYDDAAKRYFKNPCLNFPEYEAVPLVQTTKVTGMAQV